MEAFGPPSFDAHDIPLAAANDRDIAQRPGPLICFSHLRWDFVFQRPQHLMSRFAKGRRVFFFEEPIPCDHHRAYLEHHPFPEQDVTALRPRYPHWWSAAERDKALSSLLDMLVAQNGGGLPLLWFYAPMMFPIARHLEAAAIVYDCMDELSAFRSAPAELPMLEAELIERADVVFTGGRSLYEAKRGLHDNIHLFASSVDVAHFQRARNGKLPEPADQAGMPHPRFGFFGVVDERMDLDLVRQVAESRPEWHVVVVGPIVKIDPANLPRLPNIHYLGPKSYDDLPAYLSGWDVALMPFALNDSTTFISPTKTPEYLAGGRPVVSTPIADVVRHYGDLAGVAIAGTPDTFLAACADQLARARDVASWLPAVDTVLAQGSWDKTFKRMAGLVDEAIERRAMPIARPSSLAPASLVFRPTVRSSNCPKPYDALIVGAGFAGAVLAERLAAGSGQRVLVVDRRPHIAGNAYDHLDAAGILVHRYGPHIFHTNSADVSTYLSRFTRWRPYEHRVLADVGAGKLLPMPINRTTLNGLYGLSLATDEEAAAFLQGRAEPLPTIRTAEDAVVSQVGRDLYETFFRGYTRKQWGLDPSDLDRTVTQRVPTRTGLDDRYFQDTFQAMPADGYTRMFEAMLDHPLIDVELGVEYRDVWDAVVADHTIFTGPIDEYFDFRFGRLPYRSLEFRHETLNRRRLQPVGVINYPSESVPYTRITEYKHLTGQSHPQTSISYEIPQAEGDPYYPILRPANQALYKRYEALAQALPNVSFVGRLATYRYYNMDQVVGQALATYRRLTERGTMPVKTALQSTSAMV